jgi:hypothetical protein
VTPDQQHIRTTSAREDADSEELRLERAAKVARLAYQRSQRSFIVSFVAMVLAIASIVEGHL